ncbi:RHS repeat domain-containing protein [Tumebacillus permanentifrigoris]|uniref:RHS repeat domain-containing protein n=1 Tax=Tumebacillus permanentifrigoris TaxID=378543 RepID=UPI001B871D8F|nr:RHS repeat domain-containing protein [Tumebacillus permanentifrigoris]
MKTKRLLSAVTATLILLTSLAPTVQAQDSKKSTVQLSPVDKLSQEFDVPADEIQNALFEGQTIQEVRKSLETAKKNKKSLKEALHQQRPSTKRNDETPKVVIDPAPTEEEVRALTATPSTNTATSESKYDPNLKFDQVPFAVPVGNSMISTLSGSSVLSNDDLTIQAENGLEFTLNRSYDSGSSMALEQASGTPRLSLEQQLYQLGGGWSWNIPWVEPVSAPNYDGRYDSYLHLPGQGTYRMTSYYSAADFNYHYTLENYPYQDYKIEYINGVPQIKFYKSDITYIFGDSSTKMVNSKGGSITFTKELVPLRGQSYNLVTSIQSSTGGYIKIAYTDLQYTLTAGNTNSSTQQKVLYKFTKNSLPERSTDFYTLNEVVDPVGRSTKYSYAVKGAYYWTATSYYLYDPYVLVSDVVYPTGSKTSFTYTKVDPVYVNNGMRSNYLVSDVATYTPTDATTKFNHYTMQYTGEQNVPSNLNFIEPFTRTLSDELGNKTVFTYQQVYYTDYSYYLLTSKNETHDQWQINNTYTYDTVRRFTIPNTVTSDTFKVSTPQTKTTTTTTSEYDNLGNVIKQVGANGQTTTHTYTKYTDTNNQDHYYLTNTRVYLQGSPSATSGNKYSDTNTTYETSSGLVTKVEVKDQDNTLLRQSTYTYDKNASGAVTAVHENITDTGGKTISSTTAYDTTAQFKITQSSSLTDPDGKVTPLTTQYTFDNVLGQPVQSTDAKGNITTYAYDALGRVTKAIFPDKASMTFAYDDINNTVTKIDKNETTGQTLKTAVNKFNAMGWKYEQGLYINGQYQARLKNVYDTYGRVKHTEDVTGHGADATFDAYGRPTTVTNTQDGSKTTTDYNDVARTKKVTDADGIATQETSDVLGHVLKSEVLKTTGSQVLQTAQYDLAGNVLSKTDGNNNTYTYSYDALSQLFAVTDPENRTTSYGYDMRGNRTSVKYPDGKTETTTFDELGSPSTSTDTLLKTVKTYYDANHNPIKQSDRTGQYTYSFEYNNRNQQTKKTVTSTSGVTDSISYEYDLLGHRTKMVDATGSTTFAYQEDEALTGVTFPDSKSIGYTYLANGQRSKLLDPAGNETYFTYNANNQLSTVQLTSATSTPEVTYTYTPGGKLQQSTQANQVVTTYGFNDIGQLSALTQKQGANTVNNASYSYDLAGNLSAKTENTAPSAYTYDKLNRISTSSQFNENYSYDARGNRSTLATERDNVVAERGGTYEYDGWQRLTKVTTDKNEVVTYKYNGDNQLYERTTSDKTTRFYYDGQSLVAEADVTSGTPVFTARYVRGQGLIERIDDAAAGRKGYYTMNNHGDVKEIRDANGALLNSYEYDIWGNPITMQEQMSNPFLYSGEYWDNTASLQYLRARWYDPVQGRFMIQDTYLGQVENPLSLNLYAYVQNNPIRFFDPTGHITSEEVNLYKNGQMSPAAYSYLWHLTNEYLLADDENKEGWHNLAESFRKNKYKTTGGAFTNVDEDITAMPTIPTGDLTKEQHYFRNKLNLQYSWSNFQKIQDSLPEEFKWVELPWYKTLLHMHSGFTNTKYVSADGHFEMVFDSDHVLLTEYNFPSDMGTYNYYSPNDEDMHSKYDIAPWVKWNNIP